MMFALRYYVPDGERAPRWYGFAWYDWLRGQAVAYPIPLNWIAWFVRASYYRLAKTPYAKIDRLYQDACKRGYQDGHRAGYQAGVEQHASEFREVINFLGVKR